MSKFKLDKSNQKQIADMLHDLVEQLDGSGFDLSYLEVAANIVRLCDAPERDTKEYWNIAKWTWKKDEPSYDPEPDIMSDDIAEDGIACEWCCVIIKHGENAYRAKMMHKDRLYARIAMSKLPECVNNLDCFCTHCCVDKQRIPRIIVDKTNYKDLSWFSRDISNTFLRTDLVQGYLFSLATGEWVKQDE